MPRRSRADIDTPRIEAPPLPIQPPTDLSEPARTVFVELVASLEPEHFEPGDVTLLAQYCEASALAARSALKLQEGDVTCLKVWERAVATMASLSLRLRLGPQSRRQYAKVGKPLTWSDRFALEQTNGPTLKSR